MIVNSNDYYNTATDNTVAVKLNPGHQSCHTHGGSSHSTYVSPDYKTYSRSGKDYLWIIKQTYTINKITYP